MRLYKVMINRDVQVRVSNFIKRQHVRQEPMASSLLAPFLAQAAQDYPGILGELRRVVRLQKFPKLSLGKTGTLWISRETWVALMNFSRNTKQSMWIVAEHWFAQAIAEIEAKEQQEAEASASLQEDSMMESQELDVAAAQ